MSIIKFCSGVILLINALFVPEENNEESGIVTSPKILEGHFSVFPPITIPVGLYLLE